MKHHILSIIVCVTFLRLHSQYEAPRFPGDKKAFYSYLYENIAYPVADRENGREPDINTTIYISKTGKIKFVNVIVSESAEPTNLKNQVKRVLTLMPDWIPAKMNNVSIDTLITQKIYLTNGKRSRTKKDSSICEINVYTTPMSEEESKQFSQKIKQRGMIRVQIDSLYGKGVIESNLKNYSEAISLFNQAKEKGPASSDLYYNLAIVYLKTGNKELACTNFLEAALKGDDEAFKLYLKMCKE